MLPMEPIENNFMSIFSKDEFSLPILREEKLADIRGGWHPFPRGILGRDGKPFIGRDVVRFGVPAVVKIGVALIPGGAPFAHAAGVAAGAIVRNKTM
jgi:hypothetical protein